MNTPWSLLTPYSQNGDLKMNFYCHIVDMVLSTFLPFYFDLWGGGACLHTFVFISLFKSYLRHVRHPNIIQWNMFSICVYCHIHILHIGWIRVPMGETTLLTLLNQISNNCQKTAILHHVHRKLPINSNTPPPPTRTHTVTHPIHSVIL